ncbi:hypothetical protein AB0L40_07460 [Patulibacter sp. NPDC049589]|uniref:hypothetical protein n=1 Tax=Patulibacter sp. NPDC049589 TaxID=3154731 RepID=UPI0034377D0E
MGGASLLIAALLALVLLTHASSSDAASSPDGSKLAGARPALGYAALDRPATPADSAGDLAARLQVFAQSTPELVVNQVRLVSTNTDRRVLLAPRSDGYVCIIVLFAKGGGMNCNTAGGPPQVMNYGAAIGAVPTSVTSVTYKLDDGSTVSRTPQDGLIYAPADATSVSYDANGTKASADLMPKSAKPEGLGNTAATLLSAP